MTKSTDSSSRMLVSGSPFTAMMSADFPAVIEPISAVRLKWSAALTVAAWMVWRARNFIGARVALALFLGQLALNAFWTWLFFACLYYAICYYHGDFEPDHLPLNQVKVSASLVDNTSNTKLVVAHWHNVVFETKDSQLESRPKNKK